MEHASKNPRLVKVEMALLNATSALGDLIAAIRAGKATDQESDPSIFLSWDGDASAPSTPYNSTAAQM